VIRMRALQRGIRAYLRLDIALSLAVLLLALTVFLPRPANAMKIEHVKSPGGLEAWLVRETKVPLLALRFAFEGGSSQDPAGKEGAANFMASTLDEGAGDLDALAFQTRMEELAMRLSFDDGRDSLYGSFETLSANRAEAVKVLKLAVNQPRFDGEAVERIRKQILSSLAFAARDPDRVADKAWYAAAFPGHPYGRPATGTPESVAAIAAADLKAFHKRVFARDNLKVVAVGDITAAELGRLLDDVFGGLPAKAALQPVPRTAPKAGGRLDIVEMLKGPPGNPFGLGAMARLLAQGRPGPVREWHAGAGWCSTDSPVAVLGNPSHADAIEVRWPGKPWQRHPIPPGAIDVQLTE